MSGPWSPDYAFSGHRLVLNACCVTEQLQFRDTEMTETSAGIGVFMCSGGPRTNNLIQLGDHAIVSSAPIAKYSRSNLSRLV